MFFSEILLEERVSDCETMRRENRRVAAMSWGADETPPPKPTRVPPMDSSMLPLGDNLTTPQTYIIAQNAAVLAQLMRENENRPLNPSAYTTPASVFNTLAVDIDASKPEPLTNESPILPLKTIMLPASELLKLNPIIDENLRINNSFATNSTDSEDHTNKFIPEFQNIHAHSQTVYPIPCEIINTLTHHCVDPKYTALKTIDICQNTLYSPNLPVHSGNLVAKSQSLERNNHLNGTYVPRISSLERVQNVVQFKQIRSNSLTRQISSGNEISTCSGSFMGNVRSASLERGARLGNFNYGFRTNSFECGSSQMCSQNVQNIQKQNEGIHERNQFTTSDIRSHSVMKTRNFAYGSLDRNYQGTSIYVKLLKLNSIGVTLFMV